MLAALVLLAGVALRSPAPPLPANASPSPEPAAAPQLAVLAGSSASSSLDRSRTTATATLTVLLRNDGANDVALTGASLGPLRYDGQVRLIAGGSVGLPLTSTVSCSFFTGRPPSTRSWSPLTLEVQTGGPTTRLPSADLPVGQLRSAVRRDCGYPPPDQAVTVDVGSNRPAPGRRTWHLDLTLTVRTIEAVQLLDVVGTPGLRVRLTSPSGAPLALPTSLDRPDRGASTTRRVSATVSVRSCPPAGPAGLSVRVNVSGSPRALDVPLAQVVEGFCGSGSRAS